MTQKAKKFHLSVVRLRELLDYFPDTGVLVWRIHRYRIKAGSTAGYSVKKGYKRITVEGHEYGVHRLIWFWMTGEDPIIEVDHKDGNPSNNAWSNLRLATGIQNAANSNFKRKNKTGFRGVQKATTPCPNQAGPFYALITREGKQRNLGYFKTPEEANAAYKEAAKELRKEFYRESFPANGVAI